MAQVHATIGASVSRAFFFPASRVACLLASIASTKLACEAHDVDGSKDHVVDRGEKQVVKTIGLRAALQFQLEIAIRKVRMDSAFKALRASCEIRRQYRTDHCANVMQI